MVKGAGRSPGGRYRVYTKVLEVREASQDHMVCLASVLGKMT